MWFRLVPGTEAPGLRADASRAACTHRDGLPVAGPLHTNLIQEVDAALRAHSGGRYRGIEAE
jgi:hypothetical protein